MENDSINIEINGYKLQQKIKDLSQERDILKTHFVPSLSKFEHESKMSPHDVADKLLKLETIIASWQALQDIFNITVKVNPMGANITLAEAIKTIGGLSRVHALWIEASKETEDIFGSNVRSVESIYPEPTVSKEDAAIKAKELGKIIASFREAIQVGNAQKLNVTVNKSILDT